MPRVLTIAGSDSGGGAGIQADLKTCLACGVFGASAVTALTSQNTHGVHGVRPTAADFLKQQIDDVLSDIGADVVKTGMLPSVEVFFPALAQSGCFFTCLLCCIACLRPSWLVSVLQVLQLLAPWILSRLLALVSKQSPPNRQELLESLEVSADQQSLTLLHPTQYVAPSQLEDAGSYTGPMSTHAWLLSLCMSCAGPINAVATTQTKHLSMYAGCRGCCSGSEGSQGEGSGGRPRAGLHQWPLPGGE